MARPRQSDRIPTWGIILMLLASAVGVYLLSKELVNRYKGKWPF